MPRAASNLPSRETLRGAGAVANPQAVRYAIYCAIVIAVVLGAQYIFASRQPPAPADKAHAQVSSTASPPVPVADSGQ